VLQVDGLARYLGAMCKPERIFVLSAAHGHGVQALREWLVGASVVEEWELPVGVPTDLDWPQLAAELVREKLYWAHTHEVPYKLRPVCTGVREMRDSKVEVSVVRCRALPALGPFSGSLL
jgi:GTPase Era involved in 16S rRNA processing